MPRWLAIFAGTFIAAAAMPAAAQWMHQRSEDPFQGDTHLAMGIDLGGYMVAFRCIKPDDLSLIFVVPERPDDETTALVRAAGPTIAVIVDDRPKVELAATLNQTPDGDNYRFEVAGKPDEVAQLARAAAEASRRVAVAAFVLGKVVHQKTFRATGSTRALGALVKGCGL